MAQPKRIALRHDTCTMRSRVTPLFSTNAPVSSPFTAGQPRPGISRLGNYATHNFTGFFPRFASLIAFIAGGERALA